MKNSQLAAFIEKAKTDDVLRQKLLYAEQSAASSTQKVKQEIDAVREANLNSIKKIAKEAGFDISMDISRPKKVQIEPTDQEFENLICVLTCCWVETSVSDIEGPIMGEHRES